MEFKNLFNFKKTEKRNTEQREIYVPPMYSDALTYPQLVNRFGSMNLSAVYRATELISDSIAMLPIEVCNKDGKVNHLLDVVFDNLKNINKYNFIKMLIQSVILRGNGFALIERENGIVTNLRFVESGAVQIHYNNAKNTLWYTTNYTNTTILPKDIIHLVKNSNDGVNGISVINYATRTLQLSHNTENAISNFYGKGACLAGVLEVDGHLDRAQKLDAKMSFINSFTQNGDGISVLGDSMHYKPVQINSRDAQMIECREYNVLDIARYFGINPILLGDLSHTSYGTLEAAQQEFLMHTLQPYINMLEEEFTKKLLDDDLRINLKESFILKTDKQAQANYYSTLVNNGILSINEARKELGYKDIEGGDKNMIAFTDINQNTIQNTEKKED